MSTRLRGGLGSESALISPRSRAQTISSRSTICPASLKSTVCRLASPCLMSFRPTAFDNTSRDMGSRWKLSATTAPLHRQSSDGSPSDSNFATLPVILDILSNGRAEAAVMTAKRIIMKAQETNEDPFLALLEWNTSSEQLSQARHNSYWAAALGQHCRQTSCWTPRRPPQPAPR